MMLASVDDYDEGVAILAYRADKEFVDGLVWIAGESLDKCSVLYNAVTGGSFIKATRDCNDAMYAYCEFNG